MNGEHDILVWHYDAREEYTVKSGYKIAFDFDREIRMGWSSISSNYFRQLWMLQLPPKVKVHVWRALLHALSARVHLVLRGLKIDPICPDVGFILRIVHSSVVLPNSPRGTATLPNLVAIKRVFD